MNQKKEIKKIKFGVLSDTHLNSKSCKLEELHDFYKQCKNNKCKFMLHAGDLIDGEGIYKGHEYEVDRLGFDNQICFFSENYPKINNLKTYFITGNHDRSYYKKTGIDIGSYIAKIRPDMIFLGDDQGEIEINGIKIRLWHGLGSAAYSLSYKMQKYINNLPPGQKPRLLFVGHWHSYCHVFYRNIDAWLCGSFQSYTDLTVRMGVHPVILGMIITIYIQDQQIINIEQKNIYYYINNYVDNNKKVILNV